MARKKKKKIPRSQFTTETVDSFLEKGNGIQVLPTMAPPRRLLYSSGHFGAKRNQARKHVPKKSP